MSILGKIFSRLQNHANAAQPQAQPAPAQTTAAAQPTAQPQATPQAAPQDAPTATIERVDMEKVLDDMAAHNPQKLNWRSSVVDLMKLTGMESTLQERRELADELGYTGDKNDTAAMNQWLHGKLMDRLKA
ncbi:MAG TPA: DUF3597 domain-containing protein [Ramlibacter sp.]|uniref:DUF3597 domain-containing protein n=1 Tax=Ramlibacter sp. TaxID=1917967 RepID=UPI002ED61223